MIGLACAFELSRRGHSVTVFDPAGPARSTSWAAAGMIAPAYEVMLHGGGADTPLARLCFESAELWPAFACALQQESGLPLGYCRAPTLALARTAEEKQRLESLAGILDKAGRRAAWGNAGQVRARLGLSGDILAVLQLPDDHQVDNRRLLQAFRRNQGQGRFGISPRAIESRNDLGQDYDAIVWARGVRETGVETLVKGQALALEPVSGLPRDVLRYGSGYIVPKADRIVIGASSEEGFLHEGVSPTTIRALLDAAISVLPALSQTDIIETWSGLRPKRAEGLPVIGEVAPGEFTAAAHYRNGVLLAPATARRIADMIDGLPERPDAASFSPGMAGVHDAAPLDL